MIELLIATNNSHRTSEISEMLGAKFQIRDLRSENFPKVAETGSTFLENATLKAVEISKQTNGYVLADDSGLEVDALNGEPGVYSSRYAGTDGDDTANNTKLIAELAKLPTDTSPSARFHCVIVIAKDGVRLAQFTGTVEGSIVSRPLGSNGFGYDPHFKPNGYEESFAQLPSEIKNSLSHRANAMAQAAPWLNKLTQNPTL